MFHFVAVFSYIFISQVDHLKRDGLEHKVERELVNNSTLSTVTGGPPSPLTKPSAETMNELRSRFGTAGSGGGEKSYQGEGVVETA